MSNDFPRAQAACAAEDTEWRAGMMRAQQESGGMMCVYLATPQDGAALIGAALTGDAMAARVLQMIAETAGQIRSSARKKPALCLCCPRSIRSLAGVVFCIAVPEIEHPTRAIGTAICPRCAPKGKAGALEGLRRLWPELRPITITNPEGGRA